MREICSSNPPVVTGICDSNKFRARHHRSLKLGSKLKYLKTAGGTKQALIEVNLSDLKKIIRNMSDDEVKNKNLDLIACFVEKILDTIKKINNQEQQPDTTDMP